MTTFFHDSDYEKYIELMREWCGKCGVQIWAYCLMPNHVHLIAVPSGEDGLAGAIGEAHRRYTRHINFREGWRGFLWQGRFGSFVMDEDYLATAARYVEMNPVRAGIVKKPWDYKWSSANAHITEKDDGLALVKPLLDRYGNWAKFIYQGLDDKVVDAMRKHSRTGRPLGGDRFVKRLEKKLGRTLAPLKGGRPKKEKNPYCVPNVANLSPNQLFLL